MRGDEKLKARLEAADNRRDQFLAQEVERGHMPQVGSPPSPPQSRAYAEAEDGEEDGIPEISADDDGGGLTAPVPKRARIWTAGSEVAGEEALAEDAAEAQEAGDEGQDEIGPEVKRARVGSVGTLVKQKVA